MCVFWGCVPTSISISLASGAPEQPAGLSVPLQGRSVCGGGGAQAPSACPGGAWGPAGTEMGLDREAPGAPLRPCLLGLPEPVLCRGPEGSLDRTLTEHRPVLTMEGAARDQLCQPLSATRHGSRLLAARERGGNTRRHPMNHGPSSLLTSSPRPPSAPRFPEALPPLDS